MKRALALVVIAGLLTGCGYKLSGRGSLPAHWKRIGVPNFQNRSAVPELDRLVSEAVRAELQSRSKVLAVQETTGVDAVLTGVILSVNRRQSGVTTDALASRYQIDVAVTGEVREVKDNSVYWKDSLSVADQYEATSSQATDLATLFTQDRHALERMAKTVAEKIVTAIRQKF
jgi:outer membrane lipopolysaccharide assembly protein LptE/RlpB